MDSLKNIERVCWTQQARYKPQRTFLLTLFTTIFVACGNVNFTNLSRYSDVSEKTYRRHFKDTIGFEVLNQQVIEQVHSPKTGTRIAAVDCTFVSKSGRHTEGLDPFYNGSTGESRARTGMVGHCSH